MSNDETPKPTVRKRKPKSPTITDELNLEISNRVGEVEAKKVPEIMGPSAGFEPAPKPVKPNGMVKRDDVLALVAEQIKICHDGTRLGLGEVHALRLAIEAL